MSIVVVGLGLPLMLGSSLALMIGAMLSILGWDAGDPKRPHCASLVVTLALLLLTTTPYPPLRIGLLVMGPAAMIVIAWRSVALAARTACDIRRVLAMASVLVAGIVFAVILGSERTPGVMAFASAMVGVVYFALRKADVWRVLGLIAVIPSFGGGLSAAVVLGERPGISGFALAVLAALLLLQPSTHDGRTRQQKIRRLSTINLGRTS